MKNLKNGIGVILMVMVGLYSCKKEELEPTQPVIEESNEPSNPIVEEPSKTELITGSYSISLTVYNGDTLDLNAQYGDQTYVIENNGTGQQILYVTNGIDTTEFSKPIEWYFGPNEEIWNMRDKDLDDNGNPVQEWGGWIPFDILKLTNNEFWYGIETPNFSLEVHMEKQ